MYPTRGFTLLELIVVMVILGVMAVVAIPRFAVRLEFESAGFTAALSNSLRFARQQAIAQRRQVCVVVSASGVVLTRASTFGGACDGALTDPSNGHAYSLPTPSGVSIGGAGPMSFVFSPLGQPSSKVVLVVTGDVAHTVTVEPETGYVH